MQNKLIRRQMIAAIKERKRLDKQQNRIKTTSISFPTKTQCLSISLKKKLHEKIEITSDKK